VEYHRRAGASDWQLEEVRGTGKKVAVVYSWRSPDGSRARWAQLLRLKNGKIVAMRDHARPACASGSHRLRVIRRQPPLVAGRTDREKKLCDAVRVDDERGMSAPVRTRSSLTSRWLIRCPHSGW
jgi:hypothetical protein